MRGLIERMPWVVGLLRDYQETTKKTTKKLPQDYPKTTPSTSQDKREGILHLIEDNPRITQAEMAAESLAIIGCSCE